MRLDHVSYVASHDQISDVVTRIGSQIRTAFVDGGIHPKFGTRNFIAPLLSDQYIEVVCPIEHPATDLTPFGQVVKKKSESGGGWLAWVISANEIQKIETILARSAVLGNRKKPDGINLAWKQLGVTDVLKYPQNPFFIQWLTGTHPSKEGKPTASISKIKLSGVVTNSHAPIINQVDFGGACIEVHKTNQHEGILSVDFLVKNDIVTIF